MMPAPAQAEGEDTGAYVKRTLDVTALRTTVAFGSRIRAGAVSLTCNRTCIANPSRRPRDTLRRRAAAACPLLHPGVA